MWVVESAELSGQRWRVMIDKGNGFYQFPVDSSIKEGDTFTIGDRSFHVIGTNFLRDEAIIAKVEEIEEVKNDKPTSRRTRNNASGKDVSGESDSGLDSSD